MELQYIAQGVIKNDAATNKFFSGSGFGFFKSSCFYYLDQVSPIGLSQQWCQIIALACQPSAVQSSASRTHWIHQEFAKEDAACFIKRLI